MSAGQLGDGEGDVVPTSSSVGVVGDEVETRNIDEEPPSKTVESEGSVLLCESGEHENLIAWSDLSRAVDTKSFPRLAENHCRSLRVLSLVGAVADVSVVDSATEVVDVGRTNTTTPEFDGDTILNRETRRAASSSGSEIVSSVRADETSSVAAGRLNRQATSIIASSADRNDRDVPLRWRRAINTDIIRVRAERNVSGAQIAVLEVRTSWRRAVDATNNDGVI